MEKGDYVLATKWSDGDPGDPFEIGFLFGEWNGRWTMQDDQGKEKRQTYRRIKKISAERGEFLVRHLKDIETFDRSVWWWARCNIQKAEKDLRHTDVQVGEES